MTAHNLLALLPLLLTSATATIVLLGIAVRRSHRLAVVLSIIGLLAALLSLAFTRPAGQVTALLAIDGYARYYFALFLAAGLAVVLLAEGYWRRHAGAFAEFYVLLLIALAGAMTLAAATHFATFFLGMEILSVSLYGLVAYRRSHRPAIEAGVKYLLLAGAASGFILFGMALVYADLGTMQLGEIAARLSHPIIIWATPAVSGPFNLYSWAGLALILVGIGFKLALVPFHLWTPDVYQGAPAPVTAFIATVSKGGVFALLLRFFIPMHIAPGDALWIALLVIAVVSMFTGNLLALLQDNIKRMLAYSSIAHMGYLLIALVAGGPLAVLAVTFYLTAYIITSLGALGAITLLSAERGPGNYQEGSDVEDLHDYRALAWRHPWLALTLTGMLLSLAGIPLTAGFIGKFYVLAAGVGAALWLPVILLVLNSGISLYYYLRVVVTIYRAPQQDESAARLYPHPLPLLGGATMAVLLLLLAWLGVWPAPVIEVIRRAVMGVGG